MFVSRGLYTFVAALPFTASFFADAPPGTILPLTIESLEVDLNDLFVTVLFSNELLSEPVFLSAGEGAAGLLCLPGPVVTVFTDSPVLFKSLLEMTDLLSPPVPVLPVLSLSLSFEDMDFVDF